jgi:uncharacterized RDD family membrane protein YckC
MAWYYQKGGQEMGPVSKAELQQLIKSRQVDAKTLVRSAQTDQWRPLAEMVRGQSKSTPVPPPIGEGPAAGQAVPASQAGPRPASAPESGAVSDDPAEPAQDAPGGDGAGALAAPSTAVCSQCGRSFPTDQVLSYEGQVICAACKPMFVQKLREGASLPVRREYGGFWIRFLAKFIDGITMGVIQWAIMIPASMMMAPTLVQGGNPFASPGFIAFFGVQMLLSIMLPCAYNTFFLGRFGATLGKMACRLKVVTAEGGKVSYARAFGRFFAEMISYMILAIGYIMAAFDDEKRALHDRICSTRVVHKV